MEGHFLLTSGRHSDIYIEKFRILEKELDQDKDEITPTFKAKRNVIFSNYQYLIDEMYAGN